MPVQYEANNNRFTKLVAERHRGHQLECPSVCFGSVQQQHRLSMCTTLIIVIAAVVFVLIHGQFLMRSILSFSAHFIQQLQHTTSKCSSTQHLKSIILLCIRIVDRYIYIHSSEEPTSMVQVCFMLLLSSCLQHKYTTSVRQQYCVRIATMRPLRIKNGKLKKFPALHKSIVRQNWLLKMTI